ncbi:Uncharacterised protein [Segatella copri]|nr:Uncharacterised protein [Segatella copri]
MTCDSSVIDVSYIYSFHAQLRGDGFGNRLA